MGREQGGGKRAGSSEARGGRSATWRNGRANQSHPSRRGPSAATIAAALAA